LPDEVNLDQLVAQQGGGGGRELSPLQWVGLVLGLSLLVAMGVATIGIALIAFIGTAAAQAPMPPNTYTPEAVAQYREAVSIYTTIGDAPLVRAKDLFQLVVITALLPPFTAVLGYIFGTQGGARTP